MKEANKIYCSLDIETTGFDPLKDEILELGFAFFKAGENGFEITEEYSKVFKPSVPVPEVIFGLTGINKQELENAPKFIDHKEEIQKKLEGAIIVGHNINFDVNFLKNLGIIFGGRTIDTLDLVQFILPTHPSYNLENLMHYFGVPHTKAHRALADAKACIKILEDLLGTYSAFPHSLKTQIEELAEPFNVDWLDLLKSKVKIKTEFPKENKSIHNFELSSKDDLKLEPGTFYNFPIGVDLCKTISERMRYDRKKTLFVVPKRWQVLDLWKNEIAEPIFLEEQQFDEKKFEKLLVKKPDDVNELKFIIKILVWKTLNWQTKSLLDLNLSFFGGQYKSLIVGGVGKIKTGKLLVCDYFVFSRLIKNKKYKNRKIIFIGLPELEKSISENIAEKISWGYLNYLFKGVYDSETGFGDLGKKEFVEEGLNAGDLFFGLVNALLQREPAGFLQLELSEFVENQDAFEKIHSAALNLSEKLIDLSAKINLVELKEYASNLKKFFLQEINRVKWLELSPTASAFYSSPVQIQELAKAYLNFGKETILCDSLPVRNVIPYFNKRLGLDRFNLVEVGTASSVKHDLFSSSETKKSLPLMQIFPKDLSEPEILSFCGKKNLPGAILFGSSLLVKEFFHANHENLKKESFIFAQTSTGGNRIFRNFSIHKNALLLGTDRFVLKFLVSENALPNLKVKTLVLGHLPFEQYNHPYLKALAKEFSNPFTEFSLPRAVLNLHLLIRFFWSDELKNIYLFDAKMQKEYSNVFYDYFKEIQLVD